MAYLFINTACHPRGIALVDEDQVLASHWWQETGQDSEQIFGSLERLCAEAGLKLANLAGIFVVKGPGSFTGIRVGITVANALAYAHQLPVYPLLTSNFLWSCFPGRSGFNWRAGMGHNYFAASAATVTVVVAGGEEVADGVLVEELETGEAERGLPGAIADWLQQLAAVKTAEPFYLKPAGLTQPRRGTLK